MSYGIKCVTANGKVYDTSSIPAMLYEVLSISGGSSGSKAYPELAGFHIDCATYKYSQDAIESLSDHKITYDAGYPVLSWTPTRKGYSPAAQTFFVFAW